VRAVGRLSIGLTPCSVAICTEDFIARLASQYSFVHSLAATVLTMASRCIEEEMNLTAEQLAQLIVSSIDRHGLRGLIYEADGMRDVVMHGKVDMLAVAEDILTALQER